MAAQATNDVQQPFPTGFALYPGAARSFVIVPFDPLRGDLAASTETTLLMDISETGGTLDTSLVIIQIDDITIYTSATFLGEYTGSSITPQGGGVFRFSLVKDTPWTPAARVEVKVFLPGEIT
jgi:hypothetical protein